MNLEDYNKYYIQGSDHYLIPKDVFMELFNEMINWRDESKQLKEVIEEVREYINSKVISNGEIIDQLRKIEVKELLKIMQKAKGDVKNEN